MFLELPFSIIFRKQTSYCRTTVCYCLILLTRNMDFYIIIVMALIIMASGQSVEDRFYAELVQPQWSSNTEISDLSKFMKIFQSSSEFRKPHKSSIENHHLSSSKSQHANNVVNTPKPHKVIFENPTTEIFTNIECNPSTNLTVKDQNHSAESDPSSSEDSVQSDFSSSMLAGFPNLKSNASSLEKDRPDFSANLHFVNVSSENIADSENKTDREIEDFVANNDFAIVAQEEVDSVQSDFSVNNLSGGNSESVFNNTVTVTTISLESDKLTEEATTVDYVSTVTTIIPSEEITLPINTTGEQDTIINSNNQEEVPGNVNTEMDYYTTDQISSTPFSYSTMKETATTDSGLIEEHLTEMVSSSQGFDKFSNNQMCSETASIDSVKQNDLVTEVTSIISQETQESVTANIYETEKESSTVHSFDSFGNQQGSIVANSSSGSIANENLSMSAMFPSVNIVNKQESATSATGNDSDVLSGALNESGNIVNKSDSTTSINDQESIAIVTPFPLNEINQTQNHFNKTSHKSFGNEVASGNLFDKHEPVTIVWPYHFPTTNKPFAANEQEPITIVTAINPTLMQNLAAGWPAHNQFNNMKNKPLEGTTISISPEQKPMTTPSTVHNFMEGFNQMQNQFFNRPSEGQIFPSIFRDFTNQQKSPTSDLFNHIKHQWSINNENNPVEHPSHENVGSTFNNAQKPLTAIINKPVGGEITISSTSTNAQQHNIQGQFQESISNGFISEQNKFYNQMQNQFFNKPIESQMSPPFFGGFSNQEKPSILNGFVPKNKPSGGGSSTNQMQNQFFNRPTVDQTFSASSDSFVNKQKEPTPDIFNQMMDQQNVGDQISVGTVESSNIINEPNLVAASNVANSVIESQTQRQLDNVDAKPAAGELAAVVNTTNQTNITDVENKPSEGILSSSVLEQKPVMITSGSGISINQMKNQNSNKPIEGQMFLPFSNSFMNQQQQPASELFNHIMEQLDIPNTPVEEIPQPIVSQISAENSTSISYNEKELSSSQLENDEVSVSNISVNERDSVTTIATNPIQEHVEEKVSVVENTVTTESHSQLQNGEASMSGISFNEQMLLPSAVITNSTDDQIKNQKINEPLIEETSLIKINSSSSLVKAKLPINITTMISNYTTSSLNNYDNEQNKTVGETSKTPTEQEPSMISTSATTSGGVFNNQMQNQFFNKSLVGQMFPPSFNGFLNQQHPISGLFSQAMDQSITGNSQIQNDFVNQQHSTSELFSQATGQSITESSQIQNGHVLTEMFAHSSSINGQEPVGINSTSISNQEVILGNISFAGSLIKPENHTVVGSSGSSSYINNQNGQMFVSSSSMNDHESVSKITANNHTSSEEQYLGNNNVTENTPHTETFNTFQNQFFNRPVGGELFAPIFGNFQNQQQFTSQFLNNFGNKPAGQQAFVGSSIQSSSSSDGQKTQTTITSADSSYIIPESHTVEGSLGSSISNQNGQMLFSSSSMNGHESASKITTSNHTSMTTGEEQNLGNTNFTEKTPHTETFSKFQNQFFNRPFGSGSFAPIFGNFHNQQQSTSQFLNNFANKPAGQVFVGSSIQSSSSSDGQKTQTTITSTDGLTGKVTETKYESSDGKPITAFQTIVTSVNGDKGQTVITSNNPFTGEVSQTKYETSSERFEDLTNSSLSNENLEQEITLNNFTAVIDNFTQTDVSSLPNTPVNTTKTENSIEKNVTSNSSFNSQADNSIMVERNESKSTEKNHSGLVMNITVDLNETIKSVDNNSLKTSLMDPISTNETILTKIQSAKDHSTKESKQIKYIPYLNYLLNNTVTSTPYAKASLQEMIGKKLKYFIINFNQSRSNSSNGHSFKPVVISTNSQTGKVNVTKLKFAQVNVPVNKSLSSTKYIAYLPAKPVSKRIRIWTLQ